MTKSQPSLDEKISLLIDEKEITKFRKQAEGRLGGLTTDQYKHLRRMAKLDLSFLCYGVLGYSKLSTGLHGHLTSWMLRNWRERFKCILMPRGHYKSTVLTVGHSIQIALPDDSGICPHPENLGPNVRLLICHETGEQASSFLVSIVGHFLSNPTLMGLFPECIPSARTQRINKHQLELPRTEIWNEPTFDTMGTGGKSQGRHYNYLKLDDLIGDKARDSATEMQTAKDWFDNIQAFFSSFTEDKLDLIGTRWAFDDLYAHAFVSYGSSLKRYIRKAIELNPKTGQEEVTFPEEFSLESFEIIKRNPKIWSAQYANDPDAGAIEFQKHWKRFFEWSGYKRLVAFAGHTKFAHEAAELDKVILIDPAMEGKAGIVVTGTNTSDKIFVLEAQKKEWRPDELTNYVFRLVQHWQPRCVAVEAVLFSALFEKWWLAEQKLRNIRFNIIPVPVGTKEKAARVRGLSQYFAAANIYFHSSQVDLITEFDSFGATKDYHMLDALSMGPKIWSKPFSEATREEYRKAEEEILQDRDFMTGYSS